MVPMGIEDVKKTQEDVCHFFICFFVGGNVSSFFDSDSNMGQFKNDLGF